MRNVLLAAVSAVAILGSSPEANAIAAGPGMIPVDAHGHALFAPVKYGDGLYYASYYGHWLVYSPNVIAGIEPWWHGWYVLDKDPATAGGLFYVPVSAWTHAYFVNPKVLGVDAALDDAVKSPFNKVGTEVK